MLNLINKIALPITVVGAINYGLIALFSLDLLSYLNGDLVMIVQILVGAAGAVVAAGLIANK
jgi:uncharacterized membrane protein YuzA (DUF378 family)